ncbi:MAG TPA: DUF6748 domain-containing protein [Cellvibrionaceae bacterium]
MRYLLNHGFATLLALISTFAVLPSAQAAGETVGKHSFVYSVRRDLRRCAAPACGGWWVTPVNISAQGLLTEALLAPNEAPIAKPAPEYVSTLEFGCVQWTPDQISQFSNLAESSTALISGQLLDPSPASTNAALYQYRALVVRDAFTAATTNAPSSLFYSVKATGIVCVAAPCPSYEGDLLNSNLSQELHNIDFGKTFSSEQIAQAQTALATTGLVVSGTQRSFSGPAGKGVSLDINQIFWPYPAAKAE